MGAVMIDNIGNLAVLVAIAAAVGSAWIALGVPVAWAMRRWNGRHDRAFRRRFEALRRWENGR